MLTAGLLEQTRELQSGAQRDEGCHAGIRSGRLLPYNLESLPDRRAGTASKADRAVKSSMGFKSSALRHHSHSSVGRASPRHGEGRRFETCCGYHFMKPWDFL